MFVITEIIIIEEDALKNFAGGDFSDPVTSATLGIVQVSKTVIDELNWNLMIKRNALVNTNKNYI